MRYLFILFIASIVCCSSGHKLFGNTFVKRDVKSDLLTRAASLEKNATAEATKLRDEGRTAAADNLERDAKRLAAVAKELEAATGAGVTRLEAEIRAIEMRVAEEIRRDERSSATQRSTPAATTAAVVKRDVKSDLLTRAAALIKNATAEATKLRGEGRTMAADNLERDAKRLAAVAKELEAATGAGVTRLEAEIRAIEMRVAEEIRRDERLTGTPRPQPTVTTPAATTAPTPRPPTTSKPSIPPTVVTVESTHKSFEDQMRDSILKRAAALEAKANAEIKILQTSNREALAAGLQLEEMRIQEIATELKKATNAEEMRVLEGELNLLEIRLADELAKIERESTTY